MLHASKHTNDMFGNSVKAVRNEWCSLENVWVRLWIITAVFYEYTFINFEIGVECLYSAVVRYEFSNYRLLSVADAIELLDYK